MSKPYLPPELLDHVVDNLQVTKDALESCCLVSKSWVSRTRKHLFAHVRFRTAKTFSHGEARFRIPSPPLRTTLKFVHRIPSCWRSYRCRRGWLDSNTLHQTRDLPHPVPWVFACTQIPSLGFPRRSTLRCFQPHLLIPASRGPLYGGQIWIRRRRQRLQEATTIESHTPPRLPVP